MRSDECKACHDHYVQLSGLPVPYTLYHEYSWSVWIDHGFKRDDLEPAIKYIKRRIRDGHRQRESLMFRNLIAHPETFADDFAMAKANERLPKINAGLRDVLEATGRPTQAVVDRPARSASDIIAGEKAFEQFRAMKEAL
jgi:hypothetical protein